MKKTVLLILFVCIGLSLQAQFTYKKSDLKPNKSAKSGFDPSKMTYGGGIGLAFGSNDYISFSVAPQVGYNFTNNFNAGVRLSYSYSKEDYDYAKYSAHYAGFGLYGNYYPISFIVLTIRPEIIGMWETVKYSENYYSYYNNNNNSNNDSYYNDRKSSNTHKNNEVFPAVVIGAGFYARPFTFTINYDVVQNKNTPYGDNVFFSAGFLF